MAACPRGVVAVAGSRRLPPDAAALVARVARVLASSGFSLVSGCCAGADAAVLSAGVPVHVFAAFGPGGAGAGPASAVEAVLAAEASGAPVEWWAGGGPAVPLRARLAARTRVVVSRASAGLVVFLASPNSRGSLLAARCAVQRGLPVVAFALGFPGARLPRLGAGRWVPLDGRGIWSEAWRWEPDPGLF